METYSTQAVLSVADRGFTSKMNSAVDSLVALDNKSQKATKSIMDIAKGIGVFKALSIAGNVLKESISGAIDRFDTMKRFPKIMQQIGFSTEESNGSIKKLSEGIQGLPTSLDGITASTQKIALLTNNLDKATNTSLALNNAFLASGASTADAERGLIQYTQMLSKGTVDMQSWRTLQETMGVALNELAGAFGYAGESAQSDLYAALQSGQITFSQLNDKLVELDGGVNGFAERAKTASGGIRTSFTNLGISVTRGMTGVIQSVNDTLNSIDGSSIQSKIESVSGVIDTFFNGISKGAVVAVHAFDILAPSVATATAGFVAFKTAMAVQDKIKSLREQMQGAKTVIDAFRNAEQLATQAKLAGEKATRAQEVAEKLNARARAASNTALKSETAAKELSTAASKTKAAAEKQAAAEAKVRTAQEKLSAATIKLKTAEEKAAASATKSKAAQEKAAAAVTKAKANVDKSATAVEKAKAAAEKSGATSSELSAKAEALDMAATKAKANADKDALGASKAKEVADRSSTVASTLGAEAEAKNAAATEAGNIVQAKSSMLAITKTAVLGVLAGQMSVAEAAQWAWNASMTANPIGSVIVAATALIAVMVGVSKAVSKLDTTAQDALKTKDEAVKSSKELVESLDSSSNAYKDNISDLEASAKANKDLAKEVVDLSEKENKSAQDKAELQAYVDSLNSSMDGLNLQYDAEKDALSMTKDAIMEKVEAYEAEAKAQAAKERYIEVLKEQSKVEEQQAALKEKRNTFEKEWQKLNNDGPMAMAEYNKSLNEMNEQEEALNNKKKELSSSEEHLKGVMVESQQAQAQAVNAGAESQKISMESLNETQQAVVQSMNETWQSYADQATNMFDTLSDESDLSVAEMTANLQKNQQVIGDWANNIATLAERGVDQGLLEQLRQAGPESAGYVSAMVQASDTELMALSDTFANGGETATTALKTAFQLSDVPQGVMDMVTKTKETLNEQITSADFASIGKNVGQGLGNGISESSGLASTASTSMAQGVNDAAANTMGIQSPSTVFMGYGQNLIQGLIIGVQGQSGMLNSAMQSIMTSAGQTAVSTMNNVMSRMSNISLASFNGIPIAARVSMNATSAAIVSGMSAGNRAMSSGMNNMKSTADRGMQAVNTSVKSKFLQIQLTTISGMDQFVRAVDSGMNRAKASISRGTAEMLAQMESLRQEFYNSGYHASSGLARGISAGAGLAVAAANRVANQVAEIMRKALDINSPSRVTAEIGRFAGAGLAEGMLDMLPQVRKASEKLTSAVMPGNISAIATRAHFGNSRERYSVDIRREGNDQFDYDYLINGMKEAISELQIQVQAIVSARETGNTTAKYVDRNLGVQSLMKERYT